MAEKLDINTLRTPLQDILSIEHSDIHYIRCRVLIVCEGEKTEPNYFKSFSMMKNHSNLVYDVTTDGGKINTKDVVKKAIELRDKAKKNGEPYDSVWAVFDKDSFPDNDFNGAIQMAESNNIGCAWSNEAFELWYVYHFDFRSTPLSRKKYKSIITTRVKKAGYSSFVYKKNNPAMRQILLGCGCNENDAIRNAKSQVEQYADKKFHKHNPATTVYKLVSLLLGQDKDFNKKIAHDVNRRG